MLKIVAGGLAAALMLAGGALAQTPAVKTPAVKTPAVKSPPPQTPAPPAEKPKPDLWAYLRFSDGAMAWNLHAGRWSENNTIAEGQRLFWYAKPEVVDGQKIVWAQDFWKIACTANTLQIKSGEELGANLLTLFKYKPGEPRPIAPNSPDSFLKLIYCDNKEIADAKFADGLLGVMEAMSTPPAAAQ